MKNILLIEDDPFLVNIYTTKLNECGFSAEVAIDGRAGLRKIKEKKFDLILLDIVLPRIDGWQVLKELERTGKLKNLKVFILSNLGQKEEVEKGLKMGVVRYFIKAHYTPAEVVDEIRKILK